MSSITKFENLKYECHYCSYKLNEKQIYYLFDLLNCVPQKRKYMYENGEEFEIDDPNDLMRFCSLNCIFATIISGYPDRKIPNEALLTWYNVLRIYKFQLKDKEKIRPAIPFTELKQFDGNMEYDEYRNGFTCPEYVEPIKQSK